MKKPIVQSIRKLADSLPQVFEEKEDTVLMSGLELRLTPFADWQELEPETLYAVPIPMYIAVDHYQQLKDAFKRGGVQALQSYADDVILKYKNSEHSPLAKALREDLI
jgi:hypothetical protein